MTQVASEEPISSPPSVEVTRRQFLLQTGKWAALVSLATSSMAEHAEAQEASPVAIDPAQLQRIVDLSKTLCGGGSFDPDRATLLVQFIAADSDLSAGLDELLASPPVEGQPFGSAKAQATAQAILLYWYVGEYKNDPVPNRSTAAYQLTAWQAMYTLPLAVCKDFGSWADPPRTDPLVPSN